MQTISVQFFRNFSIIYDNREILQHLIKSPKSVSVLKYLILNRDKPVPMSDLIDLFWDSESGLNPENALKTLVSRIRKAFAQESEDLRNCIVTEKGAYQWGPSVPCEVDVFIFEEKCARLLADGQDGESKESCFVKAVGLYKGNIDAPFSTDEWIRGRSLYYQELYLKTTYRFVDYLKSKNRYDTIINICRTALNIDAFDEHLNLELMHALRETNQNNAALVHYRHSTDMYYKYLGLEPSDRMLDFYKQLIKKDLDAKDNLNVIRAKLVQEKPDGTAFVCDYSIFKDIYQLQLRNADRWNVQMFLALVAVENIDHNAEFNPFILDRIMRDLMEMLVKCLRKGDVVSRYSSSQYAMLLQMGSQQDGDLVIERIRRMFYEISLDSYANLVFQIGPIREMQ